MLNTTLVGTDRQAREAQDTIAEFDAALSSEQVLQKIVEGLPREVVEGVRRSLEAERQDKWDLLVAYQKAKAGDYSLLQERVANDQGAFLILARLVKGLSQKELARKIGLREQAIQRWEAERYQSISLSNYTKVSRILGVIWQPSIPKDGVWSPLYDVKREDLVKVLHHARDHGWLAGDETSDDNAIAILVRYVGDHVTRYGTPSLLRTGLNVKNHAQDWSLLSWKAQVSRRAEAAISKYRPRFRLMNMTWLMDLVRLSRLPDGPTLAVQLLLENGVVVIVEPQIEGMAVDGAAFLVDNTPVIGMTLLRDALDNFWFTLLHEVAHIILHRTELAQGFFDDISMTEIDDFEKEANSFAQNLLIPEEVWRRSPARIAKSAEPIEKLAKQLNISPAIIFGRIRMERKNYSIFSDKIGRGFVRKQLLTELRS